jgi:hypothetical protein
MRVVQLDKDNKVVNVIVLEALEDAPRYVAGEAANIGDVYDEESQTFIRPSDIQA